MWQVMSGKVVMRGKVVDPPLITCHMSKLLWQKLWFYHYLIGNLERKWFKWQSYQYIVIMYNIYIYNNRIEKEKENLGKLEKKKATSYSNEKKLQKAVSLFFSGGAKIWG